MIRDLGAKPEMLSIEESLLVSLLDDGDFKKLTKLESRFNVFDALGTRRQELRHSDFLSYILDPNRPHGLGDRFLRELLVQSTEGGGLGSPFDRISVRLMALDNVQVQRERRCIDIWIENPGQWLILIENKIDANEHGDQLSTYKQVARSEYREDEILLIFLTPDGEAPSDKDWVSASYQQICQSVNGFAKDKAIPRHTRNILMDYVDFMEGYILEDSSTAKLCRSIYRKHREAIDLLCKHISSEKDVAIDIAQSVVDKLKAECLIEIDSKYHRVNRFRDAEIGDLIPQVQHEGSWTSSGKGILFEWEIRNNAIYLDLVIGPVEQSVKDHIVKSLVNRDSKTYRHADTRKYCHIAQTEIISFDRISGSLDGSERADLIDELYKEVAGVLEIHREHLKETLSKGCLTPDQ